MKLWWHKITHWEYWPYQVLYVPIYVLGLYYVLRTRSFGFFNACNPFIKNGGYINESKFAIYNLIPQQYYPKTALVSAGTSYDAVRDIKTRNQLHFPLIVKPDMGLRGAAVQKIENENQLRQYHEKTSFDYLLQHCIAHAHEVGIFYVRFPHQEKGRITGIVGKEFLAVTGDGVHTLRQLLEANPRFAMQMDVLEHKRGWNLSEVLEAGQSRVLVPYGNHARGAKFLDLTHWNTPELEAAIDALCREIPEFYFGRLDVMYASESELKQGRHFTIVELNGAGSEPTHIYDPKHSVFFAWKELARHLHYMYRISRANHKRGAAYLSAGQSWRELQLHQKQFAKIVEL